MNYKNVKGETSTITRDIIDIENKSGNIYKSLVIISKRANQISLEIKDELTSKLAEFASHSDNLEEVFENREQIEISKYYEKLPKSLSIAIDEYNEDRIYVRTPGSETPEK